jgi:hypothetical protein
MSLLWKTAVALEDEEHDRHGLHPAFKAAGVKEAPCGFSRCPDMDFEHSDAFDRASIRNWHSQGIDDSGDASSWHTSDLPVEHLDLSKPLYGFEHTCDLHTLRRYIDHPQARKGLPTVFRHSGEHYVMDGHHGLAGALRRGDSGADVHMIDLDKEEG